MEVFFSHSTGRIIKFVNSFTYQDRCSIKDQNSHDDVKLRVREALKTFDALKKLYVLSGV